MNKPIIYDFTEAEAFLENSVSLGDLFEMVCEGMHMLSLRLRSI